MSALTYFGDENPRLADSKRVAGMVTASHNAQPQWATGLHQYNFLLEQEVGYVYEWRKCVTLIDGTIFVWSNKNSQTKCLEGS